MRHKLIVIGVGFDVDVDVVREVFEDVGHDAELVALSDRNYLIISSWLEIVRETRLKRGLGYWLRGAWRRGKRWKLRFLGWFLFGRGWRGGRSGGSL